MESSRRCFLLLLLVWTCRSTVCFAPQSDNSKRLRTILADSKTLVQSEVKVAGGVRTSDLAHEQGPHKESARLVKAKSLLNAFTKSTKSKDDITVVASSSVLLDDKDENESGAVIPADRGSVARVVPDTFWRNGHLQDIPYNVANTRVRSANSTAFVTRWANGVKVADSLVQYDPVAAEKLWMRRPTAWIVRNWQIAVPLAGWATQFALAFASGSHANAETRKVLAKKLTEVISSLGPAIIKGGQSLSSRPDLLPSEYLEELQKLQDDVPRFSNEEAFRIVEQELNVDSFEDVFELEEDQPIAAASIGQVYKARLKLNNDLVALKIQRPNCEQVVALDLFILRWWAALYNKTIVRLLNLDIDLRTIIDDFGVLIYRELDYRAEAANAQRFNELYTGSDVFVPKIYSEFTTSRVLTMEWIDGFRLTDSANLKKYGLDESKLITTLAQCSVKQILDNGFFHADPHAGNLLACPDGRLCFLDFGMMSYADPYQRNVVLLVVVHLVNRDWGEIVRLFNRLGIIDERADFAVIEKALDNAMPEALDSDISELNFKTFLNKLGDVMFRYRFSLPPFYVAILRCLAVLEGVAIQVDPSAHVIAEAYPFVASRILSDDSPEMREAFRGLALTYDGEIRWERLESLFEEAKDSSEYDPATALNYLTDYMLSEEGADIIPALADAIVETTDRLGIESIQYALEVTRSLVVNDEVSAVRALLAFQDILQARTEGPEGVSMKFRKVLLEALPEPSVSMRRFLRAASLLFARGDLSTVDPTKFVPIVRKLAGDSRIRQMSREVAARLGDRLLSRGLRAAFGLPPPSFGSPSATSTLTEDAPRFS